MHVTKTLTLVHGGVSQVASLFLISFRVGKLKHAAVREETDLAAFLAAVKQPTE